MVNTKEYKWGTVVHSALHIETLVISLHTKLSSVWNTVEMIVYEMG